MNGHNPQNTVDQNELRTHQILILSGLLIGFISDRWEWVAAQALVFLLTVISPAHGPYILVYRLVLKPLGWLNPDIREDRPQAHRFAMSIGLAVTSLSSYLLYTGHPLPGWGLVWLILILGSIALAGWCAGCFTYYMLHRLGIGGFFRYGPITDVFPGVRPPK